MPNVFLGRYTPPTVAPVPVVNFPGMQEMTVTASNGDTWDLLSPESPVFLTGAVRGLHVPSVTRYESSSPAVHGARYAGHRVPSRAVQWDAVIYSDASSQKWVEHDSAFWRAIGNPDEPVVWEVVGAAGQRRRLHMRYTDDGGHVYTGDPSQRGWDIYQINFLADQPFWEGDKITRSWRKAEPRNWLSPEDAGAVLYLSPGADVSTATMPNPGTESAYPTWTLYGPLTSATLGVGGSYIDVPFAIAEGEALVIDTRPEYETAYDALAATPTAETKLPDPIRTDRLRVRDLGRFQPAAIPPGSDRTLSIDVEGTGVVAASITPLYRKAW